MARALKPIRVCLDIPGDAEGGRLVIAADWLTDQTPPLAPEIVGAALVALANRYPYTAPNGAWSLTRIED
jgi:hypothetical protein